MNGLARFFKLGAEEADQRVASILAPPSLEAADRYLASSWILRAMDRATLRLQEWWSTSQTWRGVSEVADAWSRAEWAEKYRTVGLVLVSAAVIHVTLIWLQGPRPGWFWAVIPAAAAAFGVLVLVASRSVQSSR